MTYTTEQVARVCHEANRALQAVNGEPDVSPPWEDAPEWQRESAIDGAGKALGGATPEQQHDSWSAAKLAAGWSYGDVKDAEAKTHPCLVPYAELPEGQQRKDALFLAVVAALTDSRPA